MIRNTIITAAICTTVMMQVSAQSESFYRKLSDAISVSLADSPLRGHRYFDVFTMDSTGNLVLPRESRDVYKGFSEEISRSVSRFRDSLQIGEGYFLDAYWDLYSDAHYTTVIKRRKYEGFPNFENHYAYPQMPLRQFHELLVADIRRNYVDSLHGGLPWPQPIEIYVGVDGTHEFLANSGLVQLLDSAKLVPWTAAFYYGQPMGSIFSFQLDRSIVSTPYQPVRGILRSPEIFVLEQRYNHSRVRVQESKERVMPDGKLVVSFVLNAANNRFENPIIHRGSLADGRTFIRWIEELEVDATHFHWHAHAPRSNRFFFYVGED